MEFNAHNAKMELVRMMNDGLLTTEEMSNQWNLVDDAEQDYATWATDARIDADAAKFAFYDFCEAGPGAHAAAVLANLGAAPEHSKRYWKRALAAARLARAAWLAQ